MKITKKVWLKTMVVTLSLTVAFLSAIMYVSLSTEIQEKERELIEKVLDIRVQEFETFVTSLKTISNYMAVESVSLIDKEEKDIVEFLSGVENSTDIVDTAFFAYDLIYLDHEGNRKILRGDMEQDSWYFDSLNGSFPHSLNLDTSYFIYGSNLFFNFGVFNEVGDKVGVTGVSIDSNTIREIFNGLDLEVKTWFFATPSPGSIIRINTQNDLYEEPLRSGDVRLTRVLHIDDYHSYSITIQYNTLEVSEDAYSSVWYLFVILFIITIKLVICWVQMSK